MQESTVKVAPKVTTQSVASDLQLMKDLLKRQGIDLDEERARQEHERVMAEKRARMAVNEKAQWEQEDALTRTAAAEMVKQGNLIITLDGKRVENYEAPCPHCKDSLDALREPILAMARLWRLTPRKTDIIQTGLPYWTNGRGAPIYITQVKCAHCSKQVDAMLQVVF
jgi:protein-tyrosine-phosphatase